MVQLRLSSSLSFLTLLFFTSFLFPCDANCGKQGSEIVEVLLWSGGSWAGFTSGDHFTTPNYLGHEVDKTKWNCPVDCRFTTDKRRLANVDGVIFEAQPITGYYDNYKREPPSFPQKFPHQSWINHGYESPEYFNLYGDHGYMDFIDVNFTYYLDSQVPITFTCMWGGGEREDFLKPPPPKSKDKCVVFMATNCAAGGATARTIYTKELMEYIQIDSYGKCLHNKDLPKEMQFPIYSDHGSSMRNKVNIFSQYKFVLTFENNNITDYVTGAVPIYMGAPNVHPWWTPGENSIVQTDHFASPRALADYIKKMCDDDEAYSKLFEWKKVGLSPQFEERLKNCAFYGAECRLCEHLLEKRKKLSQAVQQDLSMRRGSTPSYHVLKFRTPLDFLEVQPSPSLDFSDEFSILMWVQPHTPGTLLSRGPLSFSIVEKAQRSVLQLCVRTNCWCGKRSLTYNSWTHVGVTFRYHSNAAKSFLQFYVNGNTDGGLEIPTSSLSSRDFDSSPLFVGTNPSKTLPYKGVLDDLSLWQVALSASQVRKYVWQLVSGTEEGLIAAWDFNVPPGPSIEDCGKRHFAEVSGNPAWDESLTRPLVTSNPCL